MKRALFSLFLAFALCAALLSGCALQDPFVGFSESAGNTAPSEIDAVKIRLSDGGSRSEGAGVRVEGGTVTITEGGDYLLSGSLSDGQLVIDAPEDAKVRLFLDGVSIRKNGHAAIYARSADKLVLSSVADTESLLQAAGDFPDAEKLDAAVYAVCDLTLSGEGVLNISSHTGHAVFSKDDCKLKSGTVNLEAALKGLYGKDSVTVDGGILNADVGTDAVCSSNTDASGKATITVNGGILNLLAQKDGLDAAGDIVLTGGIVNISAGSMQEGKGVCADGSIDVSGGTLSVVSVDDALHASGDVTLSGGTLSLSTGDDGVHADGTLTVSGGTLDIAQSYEGLEAQGIVVSGGEVRVKARDDGFNAAGGRDSSNGGGFFGGDPFAADADALISISGGTIHINAEGDGIDSNGTLKVSGGEVYVSGPTEGGNGALDYGIEGSITGGTVVAVGASGMAENFGQSSTQGSILVNLGAAQSAGSVVSLCDEKGRILAYYEPEKSFECVVISASGMREDGTYTLMAGSELMDVTLDSLIYGGGMMGGGFSGRAPFGGQRPPGQNRG